jgi:hypothetical protein
MTTTLYVNGLPDNMTETDFTPPFRQYDGFRTGSSSFPSPKFF